ncbi:hypothetical protein ACEPAF_266 [Sanghuangporus sanghuang]|uniref:Uncharacterized protein n=1 Tax=Sanghuangporus baumii TaxID=108892 RepID=A0A9Q5N4I7_SANBA|nr:hypothetical protein A7U60_g7782 [Sanghuangporus baumii]
MFAKLREILQDRTCLISLVATFTFLNILVTLRGSRDLRVSFADEKANEWPIPGLRTVALTPEESVHYRIENDVGAAEWETSLPRGSGVVFHPHSAADAKPYRLALFHQLSCLSTLRKALANPVTPPSSETHFCLNYIRESLTCGADDHLEMVRSEYGGRAVLPYTTRTDCSDWERVWEAAEANFDAWARAK